ncbi:methyltransferase [Actinopolyspora saharensis]|uniref:Methyltransferase domain-containing protein n=1 Tax=Actinopolyspora saharensis TaxID=995062 RepID=A0A1H1H4M2_9ACTN|nr:methyltransferase [Actinopolyspora saharensis]SDR20026.1 Methyltransferase domain-containing protein [Actinopolyspora saharensis]
MHGHSHDNIDWDSRLSELREEDELTAAETGRLAADLVSDGRNCESVVDVGSGAGGAAAAFAAALPSGLVTLVDSAPELLAEARRRAEESAGANVRVRGVPGDVATAEPSDSVEPADLVFASLMVHHLPDQLDGLRRLSRLVRPGGRLVVVESGLWARTLPWDVGVGQPGLEDRLLAARQTWFRRMREEMPGSVRLPVGWATALRQAGLDEVTSWSYLVDRPAPATGPVLNVVLRRLRWLREAAWTECSAADVDALDQLLDENGPNYAGDRDDLYYLSADTVYVGTKP